MLGESVGLSQNQSNDKIRFADEFKFIVTNAT